MIIPAAGWGTRIGQPVSKEMLIGPDKKPLIDFSIQLADQFNMQPLVITRREKTNLVEYLCSRNIDTIFVEPTREWPETVLKSSDFWHEKNIVCLPDTTFEPLDALKSVAEELNAFEIAFGCFKTNQPELWGMVAETENGFEICEKPTEDKPGFKAWGVFGFKKEVGHKSLGQFLESALDRSWKTLGKSCKIIEIDMFQDHTRSL